MDILEAKMLKSFSDQDYDCHKWLNYQYKKVRGYWKNRNPLKVHERRLVFI